MYEVAVCEICPPLRLGEGNFQKLSLRMILWNEVCFAFGNTPYCYTLSGAMDFDPGLKWRLCRRIKVRCLPCYHLTSKIRSHESLCTSSV